MFFFLKSVNGKTWFPSCTFEKIVIMSFPKVKAYAYYHLNPHTEVNPVLTALLQTFTFRQEELSWTDRGELKLGLYLHCSVQLQVSPAPCWGLTALLYFSGDLKRYLLCVCAVHACNLPQVWTFVGHSVWTKTHQCTLCSPPLSTKTHSLISVQNFALNVLQVSHFDKTLKPFHMVTEQEDSSSF